MSKKRLKTEELIEAMSDERILDLLMNKFTEAINIKLETKFNELTAGMNDKLTQLSSKLSKEIANEMITPLKKELNAMNERVELLETRLVQNELIICGLTENKETKDDGHLNLLNIQRITIFLHWSSTI